MDLLFLSRSQQEKGWEGGPMAPAPALVLVRRHCRHLALEVVALAVWRSRLFRSPDFVFAHAIAIATPPRHQLILALKARWSVIGVLGVVCSASRRWR